MRTLVPIALLLVAVPVTGQTVVRVGAGLTGGTDYVKDFIVEEIAVRQSISPTLQVAGLHTLPSGYRFGLELRYAMGNREVTAGDETDDLGSLATASVGLLADGPLRGALRWEATAGMLMYRPGEETGVFSRGGPAPLLLGGGVTWHRAVGTTTQLVVGARYDFHSFSSDRLDGDSYAGSQAVHRIGLTVALERGF